MVSLFSAIFPPAPSFTEQDLGDQTGKVFIITGSASGAGFELAVCYIPGTKGRLVPLVIDVADLGTIKAAVEQFLAQENRLDVLVHNAGVMEPPVGSRTRLGHDLEIGTHCLGPFVLTHLLLDVLKRTAAAAITPIPAPSNSVRILWIASYLSLGQPPGGMVFNDAGGPKAIPKVFPNYMQSKVGSAWLASEFATRLAQDGIMSVSVHPGLMRTELQKTMPLLGRMMMSLLFKPAVYGAYTELYAAFSPELTRENIRGGYVIAWGRIEPLPKDIANVQKTAKFWRYCERETSAYI
ncbi:putative oxidoreductase [Lachnellula hyalina]|uniref:Putative oxidoreductase n=1 Tax=Lachnellula hyalina TaxID=1316788 RepID=A0A8H8QXU8_9HELO|nr:putative oxidoreductase [Lachnellula hyalina]TVY24853.1 putative oxidoreductase [Lachnellula hyalina]